MAEEKKPMAQLHAMTALKKGSEFQWMTDVAYIWQDDAACAFHPYSMFEVAFQGDPVAEGLTVNEIHDLNQANLEAAQKVCNTCPVRDLCYSSARPEDFNDTMRAGIMPTRFNMTPHGRPKAAPAKLLKNDPTEPCASGHNEWRKRPEGKDSWYCQGCKREQRGAAKQTKMTGENPCVNGHEPELQKQDKAGYWRCGECKRARDNEYRKDKNAREKAAKMAA
jgi:hypothetical protein